MANKITSAERNKINNTARDLLTAPSVYNISRFRAIGALTKAARKERHKG